jgi:trigger factor
LDITLEKKGASEAVIKINLIEADYQPKVEEKIREYSKKANIKGFRPGKVPSGLIRKMYGKGVLVEEINTLLSQGLNDYIKENKLQVIGEPLPNLDKSQNIDWDSQKAFDFEYDLGLVEDFKLELSPKLKVAAYEIEVDAKSIDETIENLRRQYGQSSNPDLSAEGDFVFGEMKAEDGSFTADVLLPLNKVEKKELKNFLNLKKDDVVAFDLRKVMKEDANITHLTGVSKEEAAKMKGNFTLTVKGINRSTFAELDQEFFDKIFGKDAVTSEEEFRNKAKATISENYKRESDALLNIHIQDELVKSTKIELPTSFLKRWLLVSNEGKITIEEIEKEFDLYVKELKWTLIKNKISDDNKVNANHEDVLERTKAMIREQFGGSGLPTTLEDSMDTFADNYLKSDKGDNYMRIFNQVRAEKVISHIRENLTITTKKVDVEEFKKLAAN